MQEFEKNMESNTVELDNCWDEIKERKLMEMATSAKYDTVYIPEIHDF